MVIFLTFILHQCGSLASSPDGNVTFPESYSKYYRPVQKKEDPMKIKVGLVITQIVDLDFEQKSLNMNIEFIMRWTDELIKINPGYRDMVRLDNIEEIWSPDLHIYHQKQFVKRDSTSIALRNNKNGYVDVSYVFEANVVVKCDPDFKDYPFHRQNCPFKLGSWSKVEEEIKFVALKEHKIDVLVEKRGFGYFWNFEYLQASEQGIKDPTEKFSIVGINIEMTSDWQKFILLYYLPTYMITITSWFFYLLPSTSYPSR